MGLLTALVEMIPRLEAEAALEAVQVAQLASGRFEPQRVNQAIRRWQRIANPEGAGRRLGATTVSGLGDMGLRVHVVPVASPAPQERP
jgi:hypothetical protein